MIRTHKPTGHHWTCASHFQQSKQYRNLDAQDWHAPSAKTLVADPDDDLPTSLRVAKRRRVEQLANDFLEGQPLFISSLTTSTHPLLAPPYCRGPLRSLNCRPRDSLRGEEGLVS